MLAGELQALGLGKAANGLALGFETEAALALPPGRDAQIGYNSSRRSR
jgi:hypothetical protein